MIVNFTGKKMGEGLVFEVCVDSPESCLMAQEGGADRVELCSALLEGGLTPSAGSIAQSRAGLSQTKLFVMIRPRGGDFCYSETEFRVMERDLKVAADCGADGIVVGILRPDGSIDVDRAGLLVEMAKPLPVTFHRAFDMAYDPFAALEDIISIGCRRILTSGQEASCLEGAWLIAELVARAGDRITVMPGGGVTERNIKKIRELTGAGEYHFTAFETHAGRMAFRNPRIFMGGALYPPEYELSVASPERVAAHIGAARGRG